MSTKEQLTPEKHAAQIAAYRKVAPQYAVFATVLKRVLENACKGAFPEALVQAREKAVSSFAEKVARKFDKYPDAVNQMNDLCGGRVIVQTMEQVKAVRRFIEANFEILEMDDKGLTLGESMFGYRDMHYVVKLFPDRDKELGITPKERKVISGLRNATAEIQVRTWLQHAWADSTHDRLYKSAIKFSSDIVRTGNLLAAEMELGDRGFDELVAEMDGMIANYTRHVPKTEVEKEIGIQELLLNNETDEKKKPAMALKLARIHGSCGDNARVVKLLKPNVVDALGGDSHGEALLLLGFSLCRMHAAAPSSKTYRQGLNCLEACVKWCAAADIAFVQDVSKAGSLHARALARLGWAWDHVPDQEHRVRKCFQKAHELEPGNPYYLIEMMGVELRCSGGRMELIEGVRPAIRVALQTCDRHARMGIELPYAYFIAGRLCHLLEESGTGCGTYAALGWYARGIRYVLEGTYCIPSDILALESAWLRRMHYGRKPTKHCECILELLELAQHAAAGTKPSEYGTALAAPVLIVAGGAETLGATTLKASRTLLRESLAAFKGTVISGGTMAGVPGCVGDVAKELAAQGKKGFKLLAYRPERLPDKARPHDGYDEHDCIGDDFEPEQILRIWADILAAGIPPSEVLELGFGGGPLSALEYRIALSLGAEVGLVSNTGGEAETLPSDPIWAGLPNLLPVVDDPMTVRAFVAPNGVEFDPGVLDKMAAEFHTRYVAGNTKELPDKLRPWQELSDTYKRANREEAAYAVRILEAAGFAVCAANKPLDPDKVTFAFTEKEIEQMAEMEHGRWNMERQRDGWRYAKERDNEKKLHPCLVSWEKLPDGPDGVKKYDRNAVRAFPSILAKAGLEICRPRKFNNRKKILQ